jgi:hypothetical protein
MRLHVLQLLCLRPCQCVHRRVSLTFQLSPSLSLVIVGGIWTYKVEKEHAEHVAHEREANGGELPAIPEYEFLNRRVKPFPWGNNALFFNPEVCRRTRT